ASLHDTRGRPQDPLMPLDDAWPLWRRRNTMLHAHTPADGSTDWHMLDEHILEVARMAKDFASSFGADELAYWLGMWHDLGKCNPAFQEYLKACLLNPEHRGHGPDHKAAGAIYAQRHLVPFSLLIQGHHGGLKSPAEYKNWLAEKEKEHGSAIADA